MAKSTLLFLFILSNFIFLHPRNHEFHVNTHKTTSSSSSTIAPREHLQKIYSKEIGVREKTNKNDGPKVAAYLKYTGLSEGYAWCAAYISWCFNKAGFKEPKTAWSPSLFPKSRVIWKKNGGPVIKNGVIKLPERGDVFGIYFNNYKRIAHAGFIDQWGDRLIITVEGNTNEGNSRDGDGVYRKRRPISSIYQVSNWID